MAENLQTRFCLKHLFFLQTIRWQNVFMTETNYFFGKKKKIFKTQRRLHMLHSKIDSSEWKYMFLVCNRTQLSGIEKFYRKKRAKKLVKFAFYIKRVAHYDLSPKRGKSCYLIWCINIVFSLIKFLRLC